MASKKSDKSQESALQQPVSQLPANYPELLDDLKSHIRTAQVKAALSVNRELIQLTGQSANQLFSVRMKRAGAKLLSNGYQATCVRNFLT